MHEHETNENGNGEPHVTTEVVPPTTDVRVPVVDLALLVADRRRWHWILAQLAHAGGTSVESTAESIDQLMEAGAGQGKLPGFNLEFFLRDCKLGRKKNRGQRS